MQFQLALVIVPIAGFFTLLFPETAEFKFEIPNWPEAFLLLGLGLFATCGHLLLVFAASYTQASLLAPFQYLEIVGATILGIWVFGDIPTGYTITGVAIIVSAGIYLWYRERLAHNDLPQA